MATSQQKIETHLLNAMNEIDKAIYLLANFEPEEREVFNYSIDKFYNSKQIIKTALQKYFDRNTKRLKETKS